MRMKKIIILLLAVVIGCTNRHSEVQTDEIICRADTLFNKYIEMVDKYIYWYGQFNIYTKERDLKKMDSCLKKMELYADSTKYYHKLQYQQ